MDTSANYYSEAEVLEMASELEQSLVEREQLRNELESLKNNLQKILSENSTLKNELQKKGQELVLLQEQIETLNESDLQLKNAEKLLSEANFKLKEAEVKVLVAERKCREATLSSQNTNSMVAREVKIKTDNIEHEYAQKLTDVTLKVKGMYSVPTYVFGLYGLIITLFSLKENWSIVATVPEWFLNRGKNLQVIAGAIKKGYLKVHDIVPEQWTEFARHGIPIALSIAVIILLFYFLLYKTILRRIWTWNKDRWTQYRIKGVSERKKAFTAFWGAISVMVAIMIVSVWRRCPLNVFSWFLGIFLVTYVGYHRKK